MFFVFSRLVSVVCICTYRVDGVFVLGRRSAGCFFTDHDRVPVLSLQVHVPSFCFDRWIGFVLRLCCVWNVFVTNTDHTGCTERVWDRTEAPPSLPKPYPLEPRGNGTPRTLTRVRRCLQLRHQESPERGGVRVRHDRPPVGLGPFPTRSEVGGGEGEAAGSTTPPFEPAEERKGGHGADSKGGHLRVAAFQDRASRPVDVGLGATTGSERAIEAFHDPKADRKTSLRRLVGQVHPTWAGSVVETTTSKEEVRPMAFPATSEMEQQISTVEAATSHPEAKVRERKGDVADTRRTMRNTTE